MPVALSLSACKYHSGVFAPNGIIYFIPRDADNIGEFDSMTNTFYHLL